MLFQFYLFYDNFAVYPAIANIAQKLFYLYVFLTGTMIWRTQK
jgi:hypothetical protein